VTAGQAYARPQEISSQHFTFYDSPGSSRHEPDVSDLFGVCPAFPAYREDGGRYIERTTRRRLLQYKNMCGNIWYNSSSTCECVVHFFLKMYNTRPHNIYNTLPHMCVTCDLAKKSNESRFSQEKKKRERR